MLVRWMDMARSVAKTLLRGRHPPGIIGKSNDRSISVLFVEGTS
jgi:hypothetical protein